MNHNINSHKNIFCDEDTCAFVIEQVHIISNNNGFYKQKTSNVCCVTKDNYLEKMRDAIMSYVHVQCENECDVLLEKNLHHGLYNIYAVFNIYATSNVNGKCSQIDEMYPVPIFSTTNKKDMTKLFGDYITEKDICYNLSHTGKLYKNEIEYDVELKFLLGSNKTNKNKHHNYAVIFPDTFKN